MQMNLTMKFICLLVAIGIVPDNYESETLSFSLDLSRSPLIFIICIVIRPSAEGSPASTPGASDMLQRMQAYRGHPAQQA